MNGRWKVYVDPKTPKFTIGSYVRVRSRLDCDEFVGCVSESRVEVREPEFGNANQDVIYRVVSVRHGWHTDVHEDLCSSMSILEVIAEASRDD